MSEKNKWAKILSELERDLPIFVEMADIKVCLERFMSVDEDYCDQFYPHLYFSLWKLALKLGKLNLAKKYAQKSLNHLIEFKRIPQLNKLLLSLEEVGFFKEKLGPYKTKRDILIGKRTDSIQYYEGDVELMMDHPEYWKSFPEFLSAYLVLEREWGIDQWKLCYEYILKNQFEKDLFILLMEKSGELNRPGFQKKFMELLNVKKIKFKKNELPKIEKTISAPKDRLIIDYDLVAMSLLSGAIGPTDEEQSRVLNSLKFISKEELRLKGLDMAIAFELLGMEQVVFCLCEQLVKISNDVKMIIGAYYVWAQSLESAGKYFKVIELVDEVIDTQPLFEDERVAFIYLKAEACLKLKKNKMAKSLYLEIKTLNPHYRSIRERLKIIEAN
ncbi:MAG: hypothetical protein KBD76_08840 [Bacteriovorax sp.]|jgi:tetratricopeptide (TPR) repeat protein|nr:hypothetical protein [Bacteriovorax sp.]